MCVYARGYARKRELRRGSAERKTKENGERKTRENRGEGSIALGEWSEHIS